MKLDEILTDQLKKNDSKTEKNTWEKPKIIELQVKDTFGAWNGPNPDTDKRRS
jgi:hypothetical protein